MHFLFADFRIGLFVSLIAARRRALRLRCDLGWGTPKNAWLRPRNTPAQIHFRNLTIPCLWPRPFLNFKKSGEASMRVATGIALIIAASATMAQGQSLQEQATCAQQAKAAFQDYKEGAPPGFSDYQSHYNKELNKCFILINQRSELNGQPVMATELYDAVERRWLASYTQLTKEGKEYLLNCELKPTSQEKETICKSKQEFDAFVSKYMEQ
jgi:hypothetical protein